MFACRLLELVPFRWPESEDLRSRISTTNFLHIRVAPELLSQLKSVSHEDGSSHRNKEQDIYEPWNVHRECHYKTGQWGALLVYRRPPFPLTFVRLPSVPAPAQGENPNRGLAVRNGSRALKGHDFSRVASALESMLGLSPRGKVFRNRNSHHGLLGKRRCLPPRAQTNLPRICRLLSPFVAQ